MQKELVRHLTRCKAWGLAAAGLILAASVPAHAVVCVVPDAGGTAQMPPECPDGYQSPDDVHMIIDGLPPGTTILVDATHQKFGLMSSGPGGSLGGEFERFSSFLFLNLTGTGSLTGFNRFAGMQPICETHIGPRMLGAPVQSFPTVFWTMQGQLPPGDPDFDLLRITAGTGFGMPSPGHTTLTQVGGGWAVDSFFDITYRLDFVGAPGGPLAGRSGSTTGTIRMGTGSEACCLPDGTCADLVRQECLDQGGQPQGPTSDCSTIVCAPQQCGPTSDGTACVPVQCPVATQQCLPTCVNYNPASGAVRVLVCECRNPNECHVGLPGPAPRGADPCVVMDDGSGTVSLPPEGCEYLSPDEVHMIVDGLPSGTTIELAAIHKDFICTKVCGHQGTSQPCKQPGGIFGGEVECFDSTLEIALTGTGDLAGYSRALSVSVGCETHTGPRNVGDPVQTFPTEMFMLDGQIVGDPDFDLLRVTGGTGNGLPSPGQTTLSLQPGGTWTVDSFFDITYRVDFIGAPGGPLAGMSGSTTATIRMVAGGPTPPSCVGGCPTGLVCVERRIPRPDGSFDICCRCEPPPTEACCFPSGGCADMTPADCQANGGTPQGAGTDCSTVVCTPADCGPNANQTACLPVACPNTTHQCLPRCVTFDPITGTFRVDACECAPPNECHVAIPGGPSPRGGGNPCVVPDNGGGTVTLPPPGCDYLSPDDVHRIIDGLPPGTTIELAAIHRDFICNRNPTGDGVCSFPVGVDCDQPGGSLGGEQECADSSLGLNLTGTGSLAGYNRTLSLPISFETHTAPRTPGDPVQSFDTDMFRLFGQITGDPDFDLLRVVGGTDFGLPSPGHTTLTQLPGGNWAVDSFFDITYRVDFVGAPGGPLAGMSGSTTATIRMTAGTGGSCVGGCPAGFTCTETRTVNADGSISVCCKCDPTPTVACCFPDGTCADLTAADCQTQGGIPQPAPSSCATTTCPPPPACAPNAAGSACLPTVCPSTADVCLPRCVTFDPVSGAYRVDVCECINPNECHVRLPGTPTPRGTSGPCEVPDNGGGTVTLPPAGCEYLSPDEVHMIIDGLPPGTTIEFATIHQDFICRKGMQTGVCSFPPGIDCTQSGGPLGGERECAESNLVMNMTGTGALAGYNRAMTLPVSFETHTGPRNPGDPVQDFPTDMFRLFGQIIGDPDFDLLRIVGGTDFGLPSPGHTTLTQLPNGNWNVDSFFDITYRVDFVGAPGGPLAGMSGSTTATIRMAAGVSAGGPCVGGCPTGFVCNSTTTTNADGTVTVCCDCVPACTPPVLVWAHSVAQHDTGVYFVDLDISNTAAGRTSEPRSTGLRAFEFQFNQPLNSASIAIYDSSGFLTGGNLTLVAGSGGPNSLGRIALAAPLPNQRVYTIRIRANSGPGCDLLHDICVVALVGDFDDDDRVTAADKAALVGFIFQPVTQANAKFDVQVGLGANINVGDLGFWTGFFGTSVSTQPCPLVP